MSNISIQNPNIHKSPNKATIYGATVLAALGIGLGLKKMAESVDPFSTDIPVPTEIQPHIDYVVKSGDTENSIEAKFNTRYDPMNYQNMINIQLPADKQHLRELHPGDELNLPPR